MTCKLHIPWRYDIQTGITSCSCGLMARDEMGGWLTRQQAGAKDSDGTERCSQPEGGRVEHKDNGRHELPHGGRTAP